MRQRARRQFVTRGRLPTRFGAVVSSMSLWLLAVLACACGGALVLWNEVSRSKHFGTQMLKQYETLLTQAREEKQKQRHAPAAPGGDRDGGKAGE